MSPAVWQKSKEEEKERSFAALLLCLESHAEQFCNQRRLPQMLSFASSLHLSFSQPVYRFRSLQGSPRGQIGKGAHPWLDKAFDEAMILLKQVVERLPLPPLTSNRKSTHSFHFVEGIGRGSLFLKRDHASRPITGGDESFAEKAFGGVGIRGWAE